MPQPPDNDPYDDRPSRRPRSQGQGRPPQGQGRPPQGQGRPSQGQGRPSQGQGRPSQGQGRPSQGQGRPSGPGKGATHAARSQRAGGGDAPRPYNTYSSKPRGLAARLRGENDAQIEERAQQRAARRSRGAGAGAAGAGAAGAGAAGAAAGGYGGGSGGRRGGGRGGRGGRIHTGRFAFLWAPLFGISWLSPLRLIKALVALVVAWVVLSAVLFFVSASDRAGDLPAGAKSALTSSGPILTSANTVLILGLDNRPRTGYSSKEPGSNYSERDANTDTIMLWRIGGGVSRKLSIPRDTLVDIPGLGESKINAAWAYGGPKLAIQVIEKFTGIKINHLIVVDLGNFPKFINDIGGVTVKTPRICSNISGGAKDGGFTLILKPGVHHLNGTQALTLARTRENSCDPAYNDLNREAMQQQILNSIRSQLTTFHTFLHLPWAAWDAPGVIQTDMGGLSLLQLFVASEIGGSPKPQLLSESNGTYNGEDVLIPNSANVRRQVTKLMTGK